MIRLRKLCVTFESGESRVDALRDVDLDIERASYVALVGPSGSGKSTLLHVFGCLLTPTSGAYELDGTPVQSLDRSGLAAIRNRKIGFVFQKFHLLPRATALENVCVPMRFAGLQLADQRRRATELLGRVGLGDRTTHLPSELSGGQQQRAAVARALANRPALLLADEPTGNLDSKSGAEIVELLENLHGEGSTLIVVTHDKQLAARADRVIHLLDGRVEE